MSTKKLLAIHGLGGHSGWFDRLKDELAHSDIDLYAYDLPGFGTNHIEANKDSIYTKGHIESYKEWKDFVRLKYVKLKEEFAVLNSFIVLLKKYNISLQLLTRVNFKTI